MIFWRVVVEPIPFPDVFVQCHPRINTRGSLVHLDTTVGPHALCIRRLASDDSQVVLLGDDGECATYLPSSG